MKQKLFENMGGNSFKLIKEYGDDSGPNVGDLPVDNDPNYVEPEQSDGHDEYIQLLEQITALISKLHHGVETEKKQTLQRLIQIYHNTQNDKQFEVLNNLVYQELKQRNEFSNSF